MEPDQQPEEEVAAQKARQERISKAEKLDREAKRLEELADDFRKKALKAKRDAADHKAAEKRRVLDALRQEAGTWMLEVLQSKASVRNGFMKHLSSLPARKSEELLKACEELWSASAKQQDQADDLSSSQGADVAP